MRSQATHTPYGAIEGRVLEGISGHPVSDAIVTVEGSRAATYSDSLGFFSLRLVPAGPAVLRAQRIGFAPRRTNLTIIADSSVRIDLSLAKNALELEGVQVLADPASRARGELGTATVIEADAIKNQVAASLAGILELTPGVSLSAPGLDNVQQIGLRAVPVSSGASSGGDASAGSLASFGTTIVIDGIPVSNNANLQTLGPRAEVSFASAAGGGVDLRRIPASTIERVEVIRGVPSARYGDLTQGAIVVETRTGALDPALLARFDPVTLAGTFVAGKAIGASNTLALIADITRTRVGGGVSDARAVRGTGQIAHRLEIGTPHSPEIGASARSRFVFDTRVDLMYLLDDRPETAALRGFESRSRESGLRLSERARIHFSNSTRLDITSAIEQSEQNSFGRRDLLRVAIPLTTRLTPGREVGHYLGGLFNARAELEGKPRFFYSRQEVISHFGAGAISHDR
ncbi:MAG: TonB-dependent receptor [Gemmatimonadaceae bacterium]|nr:TonB-dependent receptor [Gemmatimonadaceae bacterium]